MSYSKQEPMASGQRGGGEGNSGGREIREEARGIVQTQMAVCWVRMVASGMA